MATSSIALHQKKLEFEDNQFLSSLFGYHDKNLKVLEDKFKVKLYSRGNLLSIKGNRDPVEKAYFIIQGLYQKLKNKDITIDINNSDMALLHGFLMSVSGAVEKFIMHHHLNFNEIDIYLTGGDANIIFDSLEEQLQLKYQKIENAVIEGLKIYKKLALADK